jgi:site-specific DNA-methyltransferase (cytosine-N4-specific)
MSEIKYIDTTWDFRTDDTKLSNHGFHTYPAMMIPQIARKLIEIYGKDAKVMFDPFVGSGTSLLEAKLHDNFEIAYGIDINPLARLVAKVKATPIPQEVLLQVTETLIQKSLTDKESMSFNDKKFAKPDIHNIDFWFKPEVIIDLTIIKNNIESIEIDNKQVQHDIIDFCKVAFSEITRLVSNTRNSEFKLYRMAEKSLAKHNPNTIDEFAKKLRSNVKKFEQFNNEAKTCKIIVLDEDSRCKTSIPSGLVDIVVSSPPYGDSRTTVAYGQFSRLSLEFLDFDKKTVRTIDRVCLGGIPSVTKTNGLQSKSLHQVIERITEKDSTRVKDVLSFYEDFHKCVNEIDRVMKIGGYICFVVGNRTVKGVKIPTDEIIVELFQSQNNYKHHKTIIRNIPNKRMPSKNSPTNVVGKLESTMNEEYIVILQKMV